MKFARVNINLIFRFHSDTSDEEIETLLENIELPEGYEEGSFEITDIILDKLDLLDRRTK
tara:strand:- start:874 stop:1053 length:180 start_codon:yes stop_codon:yes gene_type:complete